MSSLVFAYVHGPYLLVLVYNVGPYYVCHIEFQGKFLLPPISYDPSRTHYETIFRVSDCDSSRRITVITDPQPPDPT